MKGERRRRRRRRSSSRSTCGCMENGLNQEMQTCMHRDELSLTPP